jgi:hypothetical protein
MLKEKLTGLSRRDLLPTPLASNSSTSPSSSWLGRPLASSRPPYGLNIYVASGVTGIPYLKIVRYAVPYLVSLLVVWVLVALIPSLSTILLFYEGANVAQ